jgi:hypothetical protein
MEITPSASATAKQLQQNPKINDLDFPDFATFTITVRLDQHTAKLKKTV